jgi:hypothetical protein
LFPQGLRFCCSWEFWERTDYLQYEIFRSHRKITFILLHLPSSPMDEVAVVTSFLLSPSKPDRFQFRGYSNSRNCSADRPASFAIPPIVSAFTGLCRGMVMKCVPSHDDVFALPYNFEPGLRPEFLARLDRNFHFTHVGATDAFSHGGEIILTGIANVLNCFLFRFSL